MLIGLKALDALSRLDTGVDLDGVIIADFPVHILVEMFREVMRELVLMDRQAAGLDARHLQPRPLSRGLFLCRERIPDPD